MINQLSNVINSDTFVIEQLDYIPMGTHTPVYNRPFIVNASQQALNTIADRLQEQKAGRISTVMLGDVAGQIIQPNAGIQHTTIDNGWVSTPRYIFLLKVKSTDALGVQINSYIQGHTNYAGVNEATGSIDLDIEHHINSVIETSCIEYPTPLGMVRQEKLHKQYNVLASHNADIFTQRPTDVLETISTQAAADFLGGASSGITGVNIGNAINPFNNMVLGSNVDNQIGSEYVCKIINAGMHEQKNRSIFLNSYEIHNEASSDNAVLEPSINDNRFIKYLALSAGFRTVREVFNFRQLMAVDPTIYDRFRLLTLTKNYMDPLSLMTPEVGDHWHGTDPVTLKAYSLIESSVAMAMKYGFNKLFFTVTNMSNATTLSELVITNFGSFINLPDSDFAYLLEVFKGRYISDVFVPETMGGVVPTYAEVYVDILGTSKIKLSYAGYPENWYTIPTSANSLFSPNITTDINTLDVVTTQFNQMIEAVSHSANKNPFTF